MGGGGGVTIGVGMGAGGVVGDGLDDGEVDKPLGLPDDELHVGVL